jgi:hemerythrin-like domain-containing protein
VAKEEVRELVGELFEEVLSINVSETISRLRKKEGRQIMESSKTRREFLRTSAIVGTGLVLSSCGGRNVANSGEQKSDQPSAKPDENKMGGEVTATEDLMREHGVLRRALLVYSAAAMKLRTDASSIAPDTLQKTAKLFRAFGEEYHEKKLEEAFIFPAVKKAGGEAATYPDILIAQHNRGREITDYIISVTQGAKLGAGNAEDLAKSLEAFVLMYRNHAAREDTIIFPAWKQTMTGKQLDEMNDKFEDIEHEQFGEDGFEDAVKQIAAIENSLGLSDLSHFTAPPPPKV